MRRLVIFAALSLFTPAAFAGTATANFQGNCTSGGGVVSCTFDALRPASAPSSCPDSFIWKYFWDFGDGSTAFTGSNQVTHEFDASAEGVVELTVICWDDATPSKIRLVCMGGFGTPGCIQIGVGWN